MKDKKLREEGEDRGEVSGLSKKRIEALGRMDGGEGVVGLKDVVTRRDFTNQMRSPSFLPLCGEKSLFTLLPLSCLLIFILPR
jgi:hypothetical protein